VAASQRKKRWLAPPAASTLCAWSSVLESPGWASRLAASAPAASQSQVQPDREVVVGKLRLSVGPPWTVPTVQVGVVRIEPLPEVMGRAGDGDDPSVGPQQQRQQPRGEREVSEMVDAKLHLEAVFGGAFRDRHEAGVVDEHVEAVMAGGDRDCGVPHRCQRSEVEGDNLET
jgi:hypothetical protein